MGPRRSGRALRALRSLAIAAVVCEGAYVVGMNGFLASPLFGKFVNATPEAVDIHYTRGWSLFPTRIHARDLTIRGTDSHIEWILKLDDVTFDCSLLSLARQRFVVTRARGHGISFRARFKVVSRTPDDERGLPAIDGLGEVGVAPPGPPGPEVWDDRAWHLWTVRIDDAIAEAVREVWIEEVQFVGDARVTGGFFLKPIRVASVGPATVDVRGGGVLVDGRPVVSPVRATAGMMLEPFDPRIADGDAILHLLSGSLRGATAVPDLARLGGGDASSTQLSGRVDVPHVDLRVAHGVVEGGSQVRATAPSLRAEVATHVVLAALEVDAAVGAGRLTGTVAASRVQVDDDVTVTNLNGRVDAASLDLTAPLTDLHAVIDVDGATLVPSRLPDRPWRGAPFSLERGEVVANGQVEAWRATGTVSGRAKVAAASVSIAVAGARVTGDAVVDASVGSLRPATGEARDVRVKVVAEEVHVAPVGPGMAPWAVAARLVATAESPQVRAAEPFDVWRVEAQALTASVRLPQGRVAGSGRVELLLNGQAASADVDAEVPTVALDVASRRISGALSVNLRARSADWRSGVVALDRADLTGSRLAVSSGGTAPSITAAVLAARLATRALDLAHPFDDLSVTGTLYARRLGLASAGVRAAAEMHAALREVRWRGRRGTLEGDAALLLSTVEAGATGRREPPAFQADALAVTASSGGLDVSQPTLRDVWFHARLSGGEVRDLRSLNNLLRVPESLSFESGSAVASLDLASEGTAAARGTVSVTLRDAGLQLHETHAHGNVALALLAAPGGPDGSWVDLAGSSVSAREVRVTGSSTDTRGWSADLTVPAGVLSLSSAPRIDVDVRLAARDASAILGILLRDSLSRLVASWTVMPSLLAKAHVAADAGGVVVSGIAADGGDVSLHGLYSRAGGEGRGAFVVGKGLFTVGLALDGAGSHLRFFGLDRWLTETSVLAMTPR